MNDTKTTAETGESLSECFSNLDKHRTPQISNANRINISKLAALVSATFLLAACPQETKLPDNPEPHRLETELETKGEYFQLVERGVFSRLVGILPESERNRTLCTIFKERQSLASSASSESILGKLRDLHQEEAKTRVEETLNGAASHKPPQMNPAREAQSVWAGMQSAYQAIEARNPGFCTAKEQT